MADAIDFDRKDRKRDPDVWDMLDMVQPKDKDKPPYPRRSLPNTTKVLEGDPRFVGQVRHNEFSSQVFYRGKPITDIDEINFRIWAEDTYALPVGKDSASDSFNSVAHANTYHPVRDYLDGLKWDGHHRIDAWLTDYCGVENTRLYSAYARRWAISAVARIYKPGCQVDTVLVLQGEQGLRKSSLFRALAGPWFSDSELDIRNKDVYLKIQGIWIYEMQEIDGLSRHQAAVVKAFLTSREDNYRVPYGRHRVIVPRQGIFVGTVNPSTFLSDPTGQRRWWPVGITCADDQALAEIRDQFWAEAVAAYKSGEQWWLTDEEEADRVAEEARWVNSDPWIGPVAKYIRANPSPKTIAEILEHAIKMPIDKQRPGLSAKVGRILDELGWEKGRRARTGYGTERVQLWQPRTEE